MQVLNRAAARVTIAVLLLTLSIAVAAERDFLATDEVDQVRLAQEPNARLLLYVSFARQRIDMLNHLLAKPEAGRSSLIHETLLDFTKIIETIDIVADDAILRGVDITEGITAVAHAEKEFLGTLESLLEDQPKDLPRYRFVLDTAVETTEDSLEVGLEDLAERKRGVEERDAREQRRLEELSTPQMRTDRASDAAELEKKDEAAKKKAPSLFKKGEKEKKSSEP